MKKALLTSTLLLVALISSQAQNTCETALSVNVGTYDVALINGNDAPLYFICPPNSGTATMAEWYTVTTGQDTTITVSTDLPQNSGGDTRINIYSGVCGDFSLVCEGGDDDGGVGLLSIAVFQAEQGVEYFIVFDDRWSTNGFDFEVSFSPPIVGPVSFTPVSIPCTGCGSCVVDMNGDHLDDLVGVSSTNINMHIQQSGGGFASTNVTTTQADNPASWSMCAGDLDNNGFTDLVYGGGQGATFMIANADGTAFTEISPSQYIFSQRSNTVDINNDGLLDVFVCHDVDPNVYFINDGIGGFTTNQGGLGDVEVGGNYGSLWTDIDNDGDIDMFISKCGSSNINELHINDGTGNFTEMAASFNLNDPTQTWSSSVGDFDHDGDMDIVVGASSGTHVVMRNDITTFTEVTVGSGFDAFFGTSTEWITKDFNNDGYLDIMGSGAMMMGNGDLTWDYTPTSLYNGPIGDLNNDGFLDIVNGNTINYNDGNDNNWIKVFPVGTVSNIDGIGARVEIVTPSGTQIREIRSGEGFSDMHSMAANFGIGTDTEVNEVTITWPSGIVNTISNPTINQGHEIIEEESTVGIDRQNINTDMSVYPNPTAGNLIINCSTSTNGANYIVLSPVGQTVQAGVILGNALNVSPLESGMYLIQVELENGAVAQQQFIKSE
ncbi:MAG: hypothetical protein ACI85F_002073 [Bacteroidia bacterium]|jgi:hypothetical protein